MGLLDGYGPYPVEWIDLAVRSRLMLWGATTKRPYSTPRPLALLPSGRCFADFTASSFALPLVTPEFSGHQGISPQTRKPQGCLEISVRSIADPLGTTSPSDQPACRSEHRLVTGIPAGDGVIAVATGHLNSDRGVIEEHEHGESYPAATPCGDRSAPSVSWIRIGHRFGRSRAAAGAGHRSCAGGRAARSCGQFRNAARTGNGTAHRRALRVDAPGRANAA